MIRHIHLSLLLFLLAPFFAPAQRMAVTLEDGVPVFGPPPVSPSPPPPSEGGPGGPPPDPLVPSEATPPPAGEEPAPSLPSSSPPPSEEGPGGLPPDPLAAPAYSTFAEAAAAGRSFANSGLHDEAAAAFRAAAELAPDGDAAFSCSRLWHASAYQAGGAVAGAEAAVAASLATNLTPLAQAELHLAAANYYLLVEGGEAERYANLVAAQAAQAATVFARIARDIDVPASLPQKEAEARAAEKSQAFLKAASVFDLAQNHVRALAAYRAAAEVPGVSSNVAFAALSALCRSQLDHGELLAARETAKGFLASAEAAGTVAERKAATLTLAAAEGVLTNVATATDLYFAAAALDTSSQKTLPELQAYAESLADAKRYDDAEAIALRVPKVPDVAPTEPYWAKMLQARMYRERGRLNESISAIQDAIAMRVGAFDAIMLVLDICENAGRGAEGRAFAERCIAQSDRVGLSAADCGRLWFRLAFAAYQAFDVADMRTSFAALRQLGNPVGWHADRIRFALKAYGDMESFPRPESSIRFPKDIGDFGVRPAARVRAADFGWTPTNATEALEKALDAGATEVVVEAMDGPWFLTRPIRIPSNRQLVFRRGVRIHAIRPGSRTKPLFVLEGVTNVVFLGEGNGRDVVIGQCANTALRRRRGARDGGSAFRFEGAERVLVRNLRIAENTLDGLELCGTNGVSRDLFFDNVVLEGNARHGAAIRNVDGCFFRNVQFLDTMGGRPGVGAAVAPDSPFQTTSSIYFIDCAFSGNLGGGLLVSPATYGPTTIHALRCRFSPQAPGGLVVAASPEPYSAAGAVIPSRILFENCRFQGYGDAPSIRLRSPLPAIAFKGGTADDSDGLYDTLAAHPASPIAFEPAEAPSVPDGAVTFDDLAVKGFKGLHAISSPSPVPAIQGTFLFNGLVTAASASVSPPPPSAGGPGGPPPSSAGGPGGLPPDPLASPPSPGLAPDILASITNALARLSIGALFWARGNEYFQRLDAERDKVAHLRLFATTDEARRELDEELERLSMVERLAKTEKVVRQMTESERLAYAYADAFCPLLELDGHMASAWAKWRLDNPEPPAASAPDDLFWTLRNPALQSRLRQRLSEYGLSVWDGHLILSAPEELAPLLPVLNRLVRQSLPK